MLYSRRKLVLTGAVMAASLTLAACGGGGDGATPTASDGTISVIASTNVYGDIAKAVGGEYVSVHSIISQASADPHGYEANAQDKLAVSKASIGIENGGGYDDFFTRLAKGQLESKEIVNVSELSGLDTGADFNEHLWYSEPTMAKLADDLATRFSAELPAQKEAFTAQAKAFKSGLTEIADALSALKSSHDGEGVAITEPVPVYLLEQAGLVNKTPDDFTHAVESGNDAPASVLVDMKKLLSSGTVAVLAYNRQTESPQTEQVKAEAEAAGVPVVDFTETLPQGSTYLQWMLDNVGHLEQGLKAAAVK